MRTHRCGPVHPAALVHAATGGALGARGVVAVLDSRPPGGTDPRPGVRVGDDDRARSITWLSQAMGLGYLDLVEYEARLDRVAAARTTDDLRAVLTDLPTDRLERAERDRRCATAARRGVRWHATAWAAMSLLCVLIWTVVALAVGPHHFWPIWPTLGAGIGLLSHALPVWSHTRRRATLG